MVESTPTSLNNFNFNCTVLIEPLYSTQFRDVCKTNLHNLRLVQPDDSAVRKSRPKCSGGDNLSLESSQIPGPSHDLLIRYDLICCVRRQIKEANIDV